LISRIIDKIIARQGYLDNIYVRSYLADLIRFQRKLRKTFGLPKGVWDYFKSDDYISLWCIDRDSSYIIRRL
jgi:hypothetical protein